MPGIADLRIEWTDGRAIDRTGSDGPPDWRTRWFGLKPADAPYSNPGSLRYAATMRLFPAAGTHSLFVPENTLEENLIFDRIEWSLNGNTAQTDSHYRAVWRPGVTSRRWTSRRTRFGSPAAETR